MAERITKLQRWLDLIAYLVGRRMPATVEELMERVPAYARDWKSGEGTARASLRRKFERDKDELRGLGIPLESVAIRTGDGIDQEAYRIGARDFFLPYLKLVAGTRAVTAQEVGSATIGTVELAPQAAADALDALRYAEAVPGFPYGREARSVVRKLTFDTPPEATSSCDVPLLFLDRDDAGDVSARVRLLSEALLARKRVRFTYHGIHRGQETRRDVAAYGLMFQGGHWYLVGHDALRDAIRVFRVERMEAPEVNSRAPKSPDYDIPAQFRLRDHVGKDAWALGDESVPALRALVRFAFPASLWAERNEQGELLETRPDGSAVRAFEVRQVNPFIRFVLSLEGDAVILEPPELRAALAAAARAVAAAQRAATAGDGAPDSVAAAHRGTGPPEAGGV